MTLLIKMLLCVGCFVGDQAEIRRSREEQNEAMSVGDVEKAASFWTDDVTLRRGLGAAVAGKEAYRALLEQTGDVFFVREPEVIEVSEFAPLAFESGNWRALDSGVEVMGGKYSAQWVKEERWLIQSEVFVALFKK